MANIVISEELIKKALKYKALNVQKYQETVQELMTRREMLRANAQSKKNIEALIYCEELLSRASADLKNVSAVSDEMFIKVVMERSLLLNVVRAFDNEKIERRASEVFSEERVKEIVAKRDARKPLYKKMSLEELLDVAMENESLEIEILKAKILANKKGSGEGPEPSSR